MTDKLTDTEKKPETEIIKPRYEVAESFTMDDGHSLANYEPTGRKSAEKTFEGFVANTLNILGVKEIAGFKTRRDCGTAELFAPEGQSKGRVTMWGKGFQRN